MQADRGDGIRDVLDVGETAGLGAVSEDLDGPGTIQDLLDEVRDHVGQAGLEFRELPGAVRVEGAGDREGRSELLMEGPAVPLADELGEAVGGEGWGKAVDGVLRRGELAGPLEHHRRGHVDDLGPGVRRGSEDAREHQVVLVQDVCRIPVKVADASDLGGQVEAEVDALECPASGVRVRHVALDVLAAARDVGGAPLREVVDHPDVVALGHQPADDRAADEAGSPGDQDHSSSPTPNVATSTPAAANRSRSMTAQQSRPTRGSSMSAATSSGRSPSYAEWFVARTNAFAPLRTSSMAGPGRKGSW